MLMMRIGLPRFSSLIKFHLHIFIVGIMFTIISPSALHWKCNTELPIQSPSSLSVVYPKEVQIVYRLFLVNCYLLHVPRLPSQPGSSGRGWVIDFIWLELPWQYLAMTRNNLSIILISLFKTEPIWEHHKGIKTSFLS